MTKHEILKKYFGYSSFREGQEKLIDSILEGKDTVGVMPTGAGKSICYQVPAVMLDGITLVVSPLISLMKDQVGALNQVGIRAAYLNSSLTQGQFRKALQLAKEGTYKIVYVAPERLESEEFLDFALHIKVAMLCIDEAHCISQWGQDFRPSYMKIPNFIEKLSERPVISAFTATATKTVREDMIRILKLEKHTLLVTGFDRSNLYFAVKKPKNKFGFVEKYVEDNCEKSGVIYCATRKNVEEVCYRLQSVGLPVTRYHAGLTSDERQRNQEDFIYDRKPIIVATNAFGMGIDKSNVRYVIHFNMPKNIESYYQEAGRAGRDGEPGECILLYAGKDVIINQFFIENNRDNNELDKETMELVKKQDRERLKMMTFYCATKKCLREYILNYFGEGSGNYCGNCSNCLNDFEAEEAIESVKEFEQSGVSKRKKGKKKSKQAEEEYNLELFELLRELRLELSKEIGMPPYIIFTDKTLKNMARTLPETKEQMLSVSGVGEVKFGRYGQKFLELIVEYNHK